MYSSHLQSAQMDANGRNISPILPYVSKPDQDPALLLVQASAPWPNLDCTHASCEGQSLKQKTTKLKNSEKVIAKQLSKPLWNSSPCAVVFTDVRLSAWYTQLTRLSVSDEGFDLAESGWTTCATLCHCQAGLDGWTCATVDSDKFM